MKILLIDDKVPDPHFGAGFPRAYRLLLSLLGLGHEIYFHPLLKNTIQELDIEKLRSYGINVIEDLATLNDCIDVSIISRPHNMHYLLPKVRQHLPSSKTVYDTEALWFRRYDLQMQITGKLPSWAHRYDEIGLAKQVDLCYAINQEEKTILESNGVKNVVILAHALDIHDKGEMFRQRNGFLVVGGKLEQDSSNEDALWYYLENSWERVHGMTDARMNVTGLVTSERLKQSNFTSVNLLGHVDNLIPLYEQHRVFVASTRFATGIPWKVHEAMAHGIPCIISTLLAKQLGVSDGVEALVAATPEEFVEKSARLYTDHLLWQQIRANGHRLIHRDCNPITFTKILQSSLVELFA